MDLVSVIIPTYNTAEYVSASIDSVIAQTHQNIEIILVDDGSKDDTVSVARKKLQNDFKGPWRIIELGDNRGLSTARNTGIRAAQGVWIQLLDSDDLLAPSKIEHQLKACNAAPQDVAVVYSAFQRAYVDDGVIVPFGIVEEADVEGKPPVIFLVHEQCIQAGTMLIRRAILEKTGGFDETLRLWEMRNLLNRIVGAEGVIKRASSTEPLYFWRWYRPHQRKATYYELTDLAMGWISQVLKAANNQPITTLNLSPEDKESLRNNCFMYARILYQQNREAFWRYVPIMRALIPDNCYPSTPKHFSLLSQCIGYENAEAVSLALRKQKKILLATFSRN
jgi:glycosyltransferase involved in cell wall biosynthesis